MDRHSRANLAVAVILAMALAVVAGCRPGETGTGETTVTTRPAPSPRPEPPAPPDSEAGETEMRIMSDAFEYGGDLRNRYAREHKNLSPPLKWTGVPDGAVELALVCDDPDAPRGTWTHWLLWGLSPERTEVPQGVAKAETLSQLDNAIQGRNDFGNIGYDGPQPPSGTHRYFFRLYALSEKLNLAPGSPITELKAALEGKVLAEAETMGVYTR
jgi:Raf kinase inhibitor-like YbhB/YbcL family protein